MKNIFFKAAFFLTLLFLFPPSSVYANNLQISNVTLQDRDSTAKTAIVQFDIIWENSWRNTTNHDAVWVFIKMYAGAYQSGGGGGYSHGPMYSAGVDPAGTSPGSNKDLEIYVPPDLTGAFIRRRSSGSGTVISSSVRLKLYYGGVAASTSSITLKVIGIEMVFIPTGPFRAGDISVGLAAFKQGSSDTNPWYISSEATISVTNAVSGGYYYVSGSNPNENLSGSTFTIPALFPKGYQSFYCMKYEITEGQWIDFINTLDSSQQSSRDITSSTLNGKGTDITLGRNTVSQSGSGSTAASTLRPNRAVTYLSWMDLLAYLDWAALRPMTELEFEKAARGPLSAVAGEYAWGSTAITAAVVISTSPETGLETITTASANACYNNTTFSRGDDYLGSFNTTGALRVGIFATASSTRETSGAGYYGTMELSGNVQDRFVTVGNSAGLAFTGLHGDGAVIPWDSVTNQGGADVANWPHMDTRGAAYGVNKADGSGFRGGSWNTTSVSLPTGYRGVAASGSDSNRTGYYGGRGARTYTGP